MKDMNNYSTYDGNDYRAPWLRLNKEQMSDPFGWLLSQRNIDVRAILLKMGYNDKQIGFLLYPNQIADKKPGFLQMRQRIGQKAVQTYLKWVFDNEVKKNKIKLGESQLRKIVAESVKKVLKEGYYDPDFRGPNDTDRLAGDILDFIDKNIEKYQNANRYEAVKQVLDACNPKNNITYGHEDDIDQGHTFGY